MEYQYFIVDVFTRQKFEGAQIAVFPDAQALSAHQMQLIARELNLSETVFMCPATDGLSLCHLRIFTPQQELDFAGHPVMAAGFVLRAAALSNITAGIQLNRESLQLDATMISGETKIRFIVKAPYRLDNFVPGSKEIGEILHLDADAIEQSGLQPMLVGCNGDYFMVPVKSVEAFKAARFNINKWTTSFVATLASKIVLCCRTPLADQRTGYRVRLLGKNINDQEDPPIGSVAPAMGVYLFNTSGDGKHDVVLQRGGENMRKSLVEVTLEKLAGEVTAIQVGGYAVKVGAGVIDVA
jgi:trans-2,3-dihydro-3-hydroxyanthranilate isomerase